MVFFSASYHSDDFLTPGLPDSALALAAPVREAGVARAAPPRPALVVPAELVARIQARDETAFNTLVHLAYVTLVRFARGFVGASEAEDVVQDVLAAIWERPERWTPRGNPATYLFGTVRHHALNAIRRGVREARRQERAGHDPSLYDAYAAPPEHDLAVREEARRAAARLAALEALLSTLTERQRTAYDLRYRQGLTIPEIASILGITTRSGEQLLSRLVRVIRTRMREVDAA
jgi:RNA polymerase sigma-70 factor (ECF subfamily)